MNAYADLTTIKSSSYLNLEGTDDDVYLRKLLEDAARVEDNECRRHFYCYEGAKYMDGAEGNLYFPDDVLSISSLKTDPDADYDYDNTLTENTDYILKPLNGYPKLFAEPGYSPSYNFVPGIPRGIEITGVFGYGDGVSATPYSASGATNNGAIESTTATTFTASDGTLLAIGQTVRIDDEQMYITGISTNTITVKRGVNGTTAATHEDAQAIYIYEYPMPIAEACLITAMRVWKRKDSAFMDIVGNAETGQVPVVKGLDPDVSQRLKRYKKMTAGFA